MKYDVFGIENPLVDLLAAVPDAFLLHQGLEKNKMFLVGLEQIQKLLSALESVKVIAEPGGSCANTIIGVAQLGGKAAFCGKVGEDSYGQIYINKLREAGVAPFISTDGHLTGSTVILVTPDAARTMNTYLGACQELSAKDIPLKELKNSRRLYITGYLWDTDAQKEAALLALKTAKQANIPIAMSLSDAFCVNRHREDFLHILTTYVDMVFANREEALALTGKDTSQQALRELQKLSPNVCVTLGASGALLAQESQVVYVDPFPVTAVDTTGAGDAFAAGVLYGQSQGLSLLQSGRIGNAFASQVITHMGPRLAGDIRALLGQTLNNPRN